MDRNGRKAQVADPDTERVTYWVEFGPLDEGQMTLLDRHPMRALGGEVPYAGDGVVIEFALPEGEQPHAAFDDIRGWAIVNRLPIRGLVG